MKLLSLFTKTKPSTYFDLSFRDRKKIALNAAKAADEEQLSLLREYNDKSATSHICR